MSIKKTIKRDNLQEKTQNLLKKKVKNMPTMIKIKWTNYRIYKEFYI